MRVALIMERIESWRGGAETSTMTFADYLARLGCEVSILTASHAPSPPTLEIIPLRLTCVEEGCDQAALSVEMPRRPLILIRMYPRLPKHFCSKAEVEDIIMRTKLYEF